MPDDLIPTQNTGVLLGSGTKALWVGGTIPYEVVLPSGDWRPYLPLAEKQKNPTETMACVTFSAFNDLEIQAKQQTSKEPNWSDRFIAKMSGTTPQGNYLDKVADTIRTIGLVREDQWPAIPTNSWDSYYAPIPQDVINKAAKVDIAYESIVAGESELRYHLKQCPLQIIILKDNPRHAVTLVAIEGNKGYYFDSYSPFLKTVHLFNIYHYALKIVLKGQPMFPIKKVKVNGSFGVLVDTPNGTFITKAEDEAEWRSYSKPDSYRIHSVNTDGSTDWSVDLEINF